MSTVHHRIVKILSLSLQVNKIYVKDGMPTFELKVKFSSVMPSVHQL